MTLLLKPQKSEFKYALHFLNLRPIECHVGFSLVKNTSVSKRPIQLQMDNQNDALCEKFIAKYQELELKGNISPDKLFRATVDALELDGIRLLSSSEVPQIEEFEHSKQDETDSYRNKPLSLRELFTDNPDKREK